MRNKKNKRAKLKYLCLRKGRKILGLFRNFVALFYKKKKLRGIKNKKLKVIKSAKLLVRIKVKRIKVKNGNLNFKIKNQRKKLEKEKLEKKERERIEFPIFFAILGWQLRLALVRVRKKVLWPFKKYWQEVVAVILLISLIFSSIFWYHPQVALGATYYWIQTDWSGGATTTPAVHPENRTNWTYYFEASTTLNIGTQISLATTTGFVTHTSDADFSQGTFNNTLVSGTGTDASIILDPPIESNLEISNSKSEIGVGEIWEIRFITKNTPQYPYLAIILKSQIEFEEDLSFEGLYCNDQLIPREKFLMGQNWIYVWNWQCQGEGKFKAKVLKEGVQVIEFNFGGSSQVAENYSLKLQTFSPKKSGLLSKIKLIQEAEAATLFPEEEIENSGNSGIFDFFSKISSALFNLLLKIEESFSGFISNLKERVVKFFTKKDQSSTETSSEIQATSEEIENVVLSFIYEGENIKILNPLSNPEKGKNWEIFFETKNGPANLTITPDKRSEFGKELEYLGIYCGEEEIEADFDGKRVFVENWNCEKEGKFVAKVLDAGTHFLEFQYKGEKVYAQNFACDSGNLNETCYVTSTQDVTGATISGSGNLIIQSGGSLYTSGGTTTAICNISMGGDIIIEATTTIGLNGNFNITTTNFTINSGATVSANAKGYAGGATVANGQGPGAGIYGAAYAGSGAGYGGKGGNDYNGDPGGSAYGSLTEPTDLGSGGGGSYAGSGGAGGGKIKLTVSGTLTLNGSITANGADGVANADGLGNRDGGGGSGGSIWIVVGILTGSGSISANGGSGDTDGGGGAGGRIAIYYTTSTFTGSITAYGGSGYQAGGAGTIYLKSSSQDYGDLIVDNNNLSGAETPLPAGTYTFDNVTSTRGVNLPVSSELNLNINNFIVENSILTTTGSLTVNSSFTFTSGTFNLNDGTTTLPYFTNLPTGTTFNYNGGVLNIPANTSLTLGGTFNFNSGTLDGLITEMTIGNGGTFNLNTSLTLQNLTIQSGGVLSHSPGNPNFNLTILNDLTIESGGSINVNGKGYPGGEAKANGQGPGAGIYGAAYAGSGAGYGGKGGNDYNGDPGGSAYGSLTEPTDLGSGGGGSYAGSGGAGGGKIKLTVSGTLTLNGSITANGADGVANADGLGNRDGGGGSGGSIWIVVGILTGSGSISANGGSGDSHGGGGAGGRIAIYYKFNNFTGSITANGGSGYQAGENGTIYITANFYPSGDFISPLIDAGTNVVFDVLNFSASTTASTTVKFQLRSSDSTTTISLKDFVGPDGSTSTYYTISGTQIWSGHSGDRYIQYKAYLETTDTSQTPYLHEVSISYYYFLSSGTLISSPYNTQDSANILAKIQWSATLPTGTQIKFQIRTSPDGQNWTNWCGPDDGDGSTTTCATDAYFTDPSGGETIDDMFKDGVDDQWIQYKVILETEDPGLTPILEEVSITYVVNDPPEFNPEEPPSVNVASSTEVQIFYSVRDPDTDEGSPENQWKVWLQNLEYSIDGGQTWNPISTTTITKPPNIGDVIPLGPATSTWIATTTHWNPKAQNPNIYSTTTYIRITIDDHEAANNIARATVGPFTLDTKDPVAGIPPGGGTGININQNATTSLGNDKTATTSVTVYLSATDDSPLQMRIWETGGEDTGWVDYAPSYPFNLTSGDGQKTVYVRFKDSFGNEVGNYSDTIELDTTPPQAQNPFVQDVSNAQTSEWRIFFNWAKATESDWTRYEVYYSTSTEGPFTLLRTITDRDLNYILHENLIQGEQYCYKARYYDDLENYSETQILCQIAGGQPTDTIPPEISNIIVSEITVSSAKISWQTNEPASTQVLYSVDDSFSQIQGVAGYNTFHQVTLVGLNASTTYNFKVKSCDASNNCSESSPSQFTTLAGDTSPPSISNINVSEITYNSAKISWITDELSDSFVEYSTTSGFSFGTMVGTKEATTSHVVLLTNLEASTTYYFKVRSRDLAGNEAVSDEFSFTTQEAPLLDTTPPTISNVTTTNIEYNTAQIQWETDEPASSFVEFGLSTSYGRIYGNEELVTFHSVQLPKDLTPESTYHFRVRSRDAAGNEAISQDFTFTTAQDPQDTTPPTITFDPSTGIGQPSETQITISWTTNEDADSYIDYSTDKSFSFTQGSPIMTTEHSATLVGLKPGTLYYFRIRSSDPSGNQAILDNSGEGFTFVTLSGPNPPVISNIQITNVTYNSVTITWQTDIPSNSFVEYGFDTSYGKIVGQTELVTFHSVTLTGLLSEATYHFRVRSKAETEAVSQDYTFTTQPAPSITLADQPGPPQISQVQVLGAGFNFAVITWLTNEPATSKVVYGTFLSYGMETPEDPTLTIQHAVLLQNLSKETTYYFKVISKDSLGNEAIDDNSGQGYTFTTTKEPGEVITQIVVVGGGIPPGYKTEKEWCEKMGLYWYDGACHKEPKEKPPEEKARELEKEIEKFGVPELIKRASQDFVTKILQSLPENPFLKEIPEEEFISSVAEVAPKVVSPPTISGEYPQVEVGPDWARITWITDKKSNSIVALAKEKDYDPTKDEPYTMIVGNPDEMVTFHQVIVTGLEPLTTYYFQVRSKPLVGPIAKSENKVFRTLSKELEISDISFTSVSEREITISWKTNLPSATKIVYTNLRTQEKKEVEDISYLREHLFTLKDLEPNTEYSLIIFAKDEEGKEASSPTLTFSTGKDTTPPEISQVRTSLAISPRGDTVQAVITWLTNEPASSRVYFVSGVSWREELVKATPLDKTLVLRHIVLLPSLKPGQVYLFRVESIDSSGNVAISKDFTFLTPQVRKTIIQIMIEQFEQIFGWVKRLGF